MIDKHDILLRFKNCCSFDLYRRPVKLDHQITGTRLSLNRICFLLLEEKHRRKLQSCTYLYIVNSFFRETISGCRSFVHERKSWWTRFSAVRSLNQAMDRRVLFFMSLAVLTTTSFFLAIRFDSTNVHHAFLEYRVESEHLRPTSLYNSEGLY